jgi:hypothetical protein
MKKLFFLGACLVVLASSPVKAQTGGSDVVVVRVDESGLKKVQVIIAYGNGKTELVEVDVNRNPNEERTKAAVEVYQKVLQKLHQEGYRLKATSTSGQYSREHNFYFEKKE